VKAKSKPIRHPLVWVPSLYLAEGLPYSVVMLMAGIMYKKMGISNVEITEWISLLSFAWVIKPFLSPFLEVIRSKKAVVVAFEALGGIFLLATAFTLHLPGFFTYSMAMLAIVAFSSTTHDIAADGLYIQNLSNKQQAMYVGWQSTFWNAGKLLVQGGFVYLAGELEIQIGITSAWSIAIAVPGVILLILAIYHLWAAPPIETITTQDVTISFIARTMQDVIVTFFQKKGIWLAILFIILFRVAEGQVSTISRLFLIDSRAKGGLGLTTSEMGIAYGTFSSLAFMGGGILGGYFGAWRGLKKSMFLLILIMNTPNIIFWYLSAYLPTNMYLITIALSIEMFGFGFGFVGLMLYLMQVVAPGKYVTAHYAVGTGIMALGLTLSTMASGRIQAWLGYHDFFIWGVVAAVPVLILSLVVALPDKPKSADANLVGEDGLLEATPGALISPILLHDHPI
jgi:PAT family beta-lactamase induction signal transducer AmpG